MTTENSSLKQSLFYLTGRGVVVCNFYRKPNENLSVIFWNLTEQYLRASMTIYVSRPSSLMKLTNDTTMTSQQPLTHQTTKLPNTTEFDY